MFGECLGLVIMSEPLVYIPGEVVPPVFGQSIWFTLTESTPTLKGLLIPKFFDSEMGQDYVLSEETRDQEHL
jgi:hypothetical protein